MTDYPNWFEAQARPYFEKHLLPLAGETRLTFLQIGAFTGDASVWLLDNVLTGEHAYLVDVDTWKGSDEPAHKEYDWQDVEDTYLAKIVRPNAKRIRCGPTKSTSENFFTRWCHRGAFDFDFIYIDGAHDAYTVLNDAVSAYKVLKVGGLLAFDDYFWRDANNDGPKIAIDAIREIYEFDRLATIDIGKQHWFRKIA